MEEREVYRKKKIAQAGALFLTALLILTFFSGSIRNASLAEVKVTLAGRATIVRKISGSGVLEAGRPVASLSPRDGIIEEIGVLEGQKIKAGDTLFTLVPEKNEAWEEAKNRLAVMQREYETFLLEQRVSEGRQQEIEKGQHATLQEGRQVLETASQNVDALQETVDRLSEAEAEAARANEEAGNLRIDVSEAQNAYLEAQEAYARAQSAYNGAQQEKELAQGKVSSVGTLEQAREALDAAKRECGLSRLLTEEKENECRAAEGELEVLQKEYDDAKREREELEQGGGTEEQLSAAREREEAALHAVDEKNGQITELTKELEEAKSVYEKDMEKQKQAQEYLDHLDEHYNDSYPALEQAIASLREASGTLEDAGYRMGEASRELTRQQQSTAVPDAQAAAKTAWLDARSALEAAQEELAKAQKIQADMLTDILLSREVDNRYNAILEQRETVAKLSDTGGNRVCADFDGIVVASHKQEGEKVGEGENVLMLQRKGDTCVLNCSLPYRQALQLAVGMQAVAQCESGGITEAELLSVRADGDTEERLVTLAVYGEAKEGDRVDFYFPLSHETYGQAVPNSAIRQDAQGSFVLTLEIKTSPLGNRYRAVRIPVRVIDSDEYYSAVEGALDGNAQIITTATRPVGEGDSVRVMAE